MGGGMRTIYPERRNKAFSEKYPKCYPEEQTPEEGQMSQRPKCCDHNNKDKDTSLTIK